MRLAFAEVLGGNDPRSENGVLFRSPEVLAAERLRPIDHLTNNHLIRHRLKLLKRLLDDIVTDYAKGNPDLVSKVVVEVARDLQEFSGLSAKEMAAELNGRLKDFRSAVSYLETHAPDLEISGGLIRKCRIAMDLEWQCPFTGATYDALTLPKMEREHVVPYADRPTNALHALVLTYPEVNRMKGKQTARAFIAANEGKPVDGRPNLSLFTLRQYDAFVEALDTRSGHLDDRKRKKRRQDLMRLDVFESKSAGFTEGVLTQSSHLMRLAARQFESTLPDLEPHEIIHLPGQVTAEIRKAWNLMDHLAAVVPEVRGKTRDKQAIREITHLHHAVDAVTIGLAAHFLPKHGGVWEALVKREGQRLAKEETLLLSLGIFARTAGGRVEMREPSPDLGRQLEDRLKERRVVQHVPSDMNGMPAELNTWRWDAVEGSGNSAKGVLKQSTTMVKDGVRHRKSKTDKVALDRLIGTHPEEGNGKLKELSGALVISENFGIVLDPAPEIIPFHKVWHRLTAAQKENQGRPIRILRNGYLIRIEKNPPQSRQDYTGIWRIVSIKNNSSGLALDLIRPEYIKAQNGVIWSGMNKTLRPLIENGIVMVNSRLTGVSQSQTE